MTAKELKELEKAILQAVLYGSDYRDRQKMITSIIDMTIAMKCGGETK